MEVTIKDWQNLKYVNRVLSSNAPDPVNNRQTPLRGL